MSCALFTVGTDIDTDNCSLYKHCADDCCSHIVVLFAFVRHTYGLGLIVRHYRL